MAPHGTSRHLMAPHGTSSRQTAHERCQAGRQEAGICFSPDFHKPRAQPIPVKQAVFVPSPASSCVQENPGNPQQMRSHPSHREQKHSNIFMPPLSGCIFHIAFMPVGFFFPSFSLQCSGWTLAAQLGSGNACLKCLLPLRDLPSPGSPARHTTCLLLALHWS